VSDPRYFELIDDDGGRFEFVELALDGTIVRVRSGAVGTLGRPEDEHHPSREAAERDYAARVRAAIEAGFVECADRRRDEVVVALEAAISEDRDEIGNYVVYADRIQTLGDPRGQLIVAQIEATRDPRAQARADRLLTVHAARFLGPARLHTGYDGAPFVLRWWCGFVRELVIDTRYERDAAWRLTVDVLEHASLRWLQSIEAIAEGESPREIDPLFDRLTRKPHPLVTSLAVREVGNFDRGEDRYGIPTWAIELDALWIAYPRLQRLVLGGDAIGLSRPSWPALRELRLESTTISSAIARTIATAAAPRLRKLELRMRRAGSPRCELAPLLEGPLWQRLEQLVVSGLASADDLIAALVTTPSASLRELTLARSSLDDRAARVLAGSSLRLDILDVSGNRISPEAVRELERVARLVIP
jgi:hypothetical protein